MANETAKRLLGRIKELREAHGLSQEAFAEKAGLTYKYYQHVEAGRKRDIRLSTLEKLAAACGIELWELLNFDMSTGLLAEDAPETEQRRPAKKARKKSRR